MRTELAVQFLELDKLHELVIEQEIAPTRVDDVDAAAARGRGHPSMLNMQNAHLSIRAAAHAQGEG